MIVDKNSPTITTQVKDNADDSNIANGATVAIGTVAYDTADLQGETSDAGGTVQFYVEKGDDQCSVAGATDLGSKALGVKSDTTTFSSAGTYYFWAVYSGDDNNNGKTSACDSELVVVGKNSPTITTQVKDNADDSNIANGATVAIGTVAYDTADLQGETSDAGGTVQFYVEKGDDQCSVAGATDLGSKALGVKSDTTTFSSAGTYYFWAVYSGDDNNNGKTSACDSELVVVGKNSPTITTQVKDNADDSNIANGATVAIGTVAYDTADLQGETSDAGGTVQFYVEKGDDQCSVAGATDLGSKALGVKSDTTTFSSAGTYYFWAVYSGDDNNNGKTSACDSELVVVGKNSPTITTQVKDNADDSQHRQRRDRGDRHRGLRHRRPPGETSDAGGTVQFYVEKGDDQCSVDGAHRPRLQGAGREVRHHHVLRAGTYYFWAVYSGDDNNNGKTSACDSELVVVGKNSPTITTQVKDNADDCEHRQRRDRGDRHRGLRHRRPPGETSDAGGTVQFYVEKGDDQCSVAGATDLGSKALGVKSDTTTFSSAGTYYFWAVYSGDDNNNGKTSACDSELVVVGKNSPTITTQVKDNADDSNIANGATVAIGTVAYDTADLQGETSDAGGTVQFYVEKGDDQCSVAGATDLGSKALGVKSDTTTFSSAGTYYFWAVYSGDDNNNGKTSACDSETVIVDKNSPNTNTQVKNTNGTVATGNDTDIANGGHVSIGTAAYDTASLSGGSNATGTVQFYVEKDDASCSVDGATSLGSKALGTVSDTHTFASAGTYYFWAVYSGDANNNGSTSSCSSETVIVDKSSPDTNTQVKNTNGSADPGNDTNIANGGHVSIGTVAYDTATVAGGATGTVQFYVEKGDDQCSVAGATDLGSKALGTTSNDYTFGSAGTYYFWAVYSGDANNNGSTSSCSSETVVVDKNSPSISTQVKAVTGGTEHRRRRLGQHRTEGVRHSDLVRRHAECRRHRDLLRQAPGECHARLLDDGGHEPRHLQRDERVDPGVERVRDPERGHLRVLGRLLW